MTGGARFVGVGVAEYEHGWAGLDRAAADVTAIGALLQKSFDCTVLVSPTEQEARQCLRGLRGTLPADGCLAVLWSGHALASPADGLRLMTRDSGKFQTDGLGVGGDVGGPCAESGANQVLLVVDTCFSGEAVAAGEVAARILQQTASAGGHVWVGVLTSCLAAETARDGVLGQLLARLLADGPRAPELRVRWSPHSAFIRGDDLCDAVLKEWREGIQTPDFLARGSAWWMFPNPLYDPGAPERVVEHLLLAARGGAGPDEESWFTGRTAEVDRVVGWTRSGRPGLHVVTGSAGTGKTAIAGRVVSLSNPAERERLLAGDRRPEHQDPGPGSVAAHLHARGLTPDRAADVLAGQLVRAGVLAAQDGRRNAAELAGQVQRAVEAGASPPVIVADGVDEARGEAFAIADDLLVRLARHAVVITSTRDLQRPGSGQSLVEVLSAGGEVLDLDQPQVRDQGRRDLRDYIARRLREVDPRMDPGAVADHLAAGTSMTGGGPFLLARLVTDQLRASPVDTSVAGWQERVSHSIEDAFDTDLRQASAPVGELAGAARSADTAEILLSALTWGLGAGLPEEEWLACASGLRPEKGGFSREDVSWVLDELGRYIVQDGEDGVAVYRIAHQSLADHIRPPYAASYEQPFDPQALPVASRLLARYAGLLADGHPATAPGYLWRYAWRHAAAAGPPGLAALRSLAESERSLRLDVALAAEEVANRLARWGHRTAAVAPVEEAVRLYRQLADPAFLPDLAGALNNLGIRYSEVGRRQDAVAPTEEAVRLYRELAAANPAFLPDLASALNNVGNRYSEVGRRQDAVAPTEEAVRLRRELAAANPAFLPDLASALNNLGNRYSEVGRRQDAVAPAGEAVRLRRELAAANPAFLPDLASALNSLGNRYSELGMAGPGETAWSRAIDAMEPQGAAFLLVARAAQTQAGNAEAASWLARALTLAPDDRELGAAAHDEGRRHREANPAAFGERWLAQTGEPVPDWLTVDPALVRAAGEWAATDTFGSERNYLAAHPELLEPGADTAIDEALLAVSEQEATRLAGLRQQARQAGVETAYRPLLLAELAAGFAAADPPAQRELLDRQRDDLLSNHAAAALSALYERGGNSAAQAQRASALLALARSGDADLIFGALAAPEQFHELLQRVAVRPDPSSLTPAAVVALTAAVASPDAAVALFYLAVGIAVGGNQARAAEMLGQARSLDPAKAEEWINMLAEIGRQHGDALSLIPVLTAPSSRQSPGEEASDGTE